MDIVEPFPIATGQRKFLLVAVDYFGKWVNAELLARIPENEVLKFLWKTSFAGMVCLVLLFLTMILNFKAENFKIGVLASIQQRLTFLAYPQTTDKSKSLTESWSKGSNKANASRRTVGR
ncbi:UNVERIFIED_CONTAM: hypothetical protein Sradi_5494500 [Sesamum radiatum]|uniref:Integrase catalytic domain-containing protein n=1 Tax=Sesamum radiatum TaxID=300843 RepID=A0AAW2LD72_SESRA